MKKPLQSIATENGLMLDQEHRDLGSPKFPVAVPLYENGVKIFVSACKSILPAEPKALPTDFIYVESHSQYKS